MNAKPRLLVLASGSATGGGSGFQKLVEASRNGILHADIVCVATNHRNGGVAERARNLGVELAYFGKPWDQRSYEGLMRVFTPDFVSLSGWLKKFRGLDPEHELPGMRPQRVINIHPGPLPAFGGKGMHGHHVHEAVMAAYKRGELTHSAVTMHFVTEEYDKGPVFFYHPIQIRPDDTPDTLGDRVNKVEHSFQAPITNQVVGGHTSWDGKNPKSLRR